LHQSPSKVTFARLVNDVFKKKKKVRNKKERKGKKKEKKRGRQEKCKVASNRKRDPKSQRNAHVCHLSICIKIHQK
jgi:hypothetical protein